MSIFGSKISRKSTKKRNIDACIKRSEKNKICCYRKIVKYPDKFLVIDHKGDWVRKKLVYIKKRNFKENVCHQAQTSNTEQVVYVVYTNLVKQLSKAKHGFKTENVQQDQYKPCTSNVRFVSSTNANNSKKIPLTPHKNEHSKNTATTSTKVTKSTEMCSSGIKEVFDKRHIELAKDILSVYLADNKTHPAIRDFINDSKIKIRSYILKNGKTCIQISFDNTKNIAASRRLVCFPQATASQVPSSLHSPSPRTYSAAHDDLGGYQAPGIDYSKLLAFICHKIFCGFKKKPKPSSTIGADTPPKIVEEEPPKPTLPTIIRPVNMKSKSTATKN